MKKVILLGDSIRQIGYGTVLPEMLKNEFEHYFAEGEFKTAFDQKYRSVYRQNGWRGHLKWRLKAALPSLAVFARKFKKKG